MTYGSHIAVLELRAKQSGELPQALLDKPELPSYYVEFISAFYRLSHARTNSESGPNPIDIVSILKYNDYIVKIDSSAFVDIIQELDRLHLNRAYEKITKARAPKGKTR